MSKVRNGEQNRHKYLYFKIFYGGQKLHKKHKYFRAVRNCTDTYLIYVRFLFMFVMPTLMHTKNLYENGPNPLFFFGTKTMSEGHLMHTVLVCYVFDKLGQACLCE